MFWKNISVTSYGQGILTIETWFLWPGRKFALLYGKEVWVLGPSKALIELLFCICLERSKHPLTIGLCWPELGFSRAILWHTTMSSPLYGLVLNISRTLFLSTLLGCLKMVKTQNLWNHNWSS